MAIKVCATFFCIHSCIRDRYLCIGLFLVCPLTLLQGARVAVVRLRLQIENYNHRPAGTGPQLSWLPQKAVGRPSMALTCGQAANAQYKQNWEISIGGATGLPPPATRTRFFLGFFRSRPGARSSEEENRRASERYSKSFSVRAAFNIVRRRANLAGN